jgi:hypothetical protein
MDKRKTKSFHNQRNKKIDISTRKTRNCMSYQLGSSKILFFWLMYNLPPEILQQDSNQQCYPFILKLLANF